MQSKLLHYFYTFLRPWVVATLGELCSTLSHDKGRLNHGLASFRVVYSVGEGMSVLNRGCALVTACVCIMVCMSQPRRAARKDVTGLSGSKVAELLSLDPLTHP